MIPLLDSSDTFGGRPSLLVLVRHGQSATNLAKGRNLYFATDEARQAVAGTPDHLIPLTVDGERQALEVGGALSEEYGEFDYIYTSGYTRSEQTARLILAAYPEKDRQEAKIRHHIFLRERDVGYTFNMTTAEANAAFPWLFQHWETTGPFFARPPGGESLADVAMRVYLFLNMLFRDRAGKRVLVVAHAGTMRTFRFLLERWSTEQLLEDYRSGRVRNCHVVPYLFDEGLGRLVLAGASQSHHLA